MQLFLKDPQSALLAQAQSCQVFLKIEIKWSCKSIPLTVNLEIYMQFVLKFFLMYFHFLKKLSTFPVFSFFFPSQALSLMYKRSVAISWLYTRSQPFDYLYPLLFFTATL